MLPFLSSVKGTRGVDCRRSISTPPATGDVRASSLPSPPELLPQNKAWLKQAHNEEEEAAGGLLLGAGMARCRYGGMDGG